MTKRRVAELLPELLEEREEVTPLALAPGAPASADVPKYLTLLRKDVRLREDQALRLHALARQLGRAKRGGERITENTLIRVAVDLLFERSGQLRGSTEEELLVSGRTSGTP